MSDSPRSDDEPDLDDAMDDQPEEQGEDYSSAEGQGEDDDDDDDDDGSDDMVQEMFIPFNGGFYRVNKKGKKDEVGFERAYKFAHEVANVRILGELARGKAAAWQQVAAEIGFETIAIVFGRVNKEDPHVYPVWYAFFKVEGTDNSDDHVIGRHIPRSAYITIYERIKKAEDMENSKLRTLTPQADNAKPVQPLLTGYTLTTKTEKPTTSVPPLPKKEKPAANGAAEAPAQAPADAPADEAAGAADAAAEAPTKSSTKASADGKKKAAKKEEGSSSSAPMPIKPSRASSRSRRLWPSQDGCRRRARGGARGGARAGARRGARAGGEEGGQRCGALVDGADGHQAQARHCDARGVAGQGRHHGDGAGAARVQDEDVRGDAGVEAVVSATARGGGRERARARAQESERERENKS